MGEKKGQFLIFSAVVILLVVFGMLADMNTEWKSDVSEEQADDANAVLASIQNGINATVIASRQNPEKLAENLKMFSLAERNALKEKYELGITYGIAASYVSANITLASSETFVEKAFVVER